jgi:2-polyprenyl-3-methyl-5-hydroxy-6-metoxy-1,4-benzoquinol methylase
MMARGFEVWGIEVNEGHARVAARRLDRDIVGRYPEAMPEGFTFDCITFNDVLEHMVDPARALKFAQAQLTSCGRVVASIPNVRHVSVVIPLVMRGRWDYRADGVLDRTHLRWFTKATMRELFEDNGFSVESQTAINVSSMGGKAHLLRLLGKRREEFLAPQFVVVGRLIQ